MTESTLLPTDIADSVSAVFIELVHVLVEMQQQYESSKYCPKCDQGITFPLTCALLFYMYYFS